jgi:ferrochelatase
MNVAVLLANMGGPDSLEAVEPFLTQIFSDPHIIDVPLPSFFRRRLARFIARKRKEESIEIYRKLGGKTPLHEIMRRQAQALQTVLNRQAAKDTTFHVHPANRYGRPSLESVLTDIRNEDYDYLLVLSMYPFFATSTSGSIASELRRLQKKLKIAPNRLHYVDRYGHRPDFIRAMAAHIRDQLAEVLQGEEPIDLLLSAHSIPQRHLDKGDPYFDEVRTAVAELQKELPQQITLHLAFQSKIGPVKWLEPSTEEKIKELAGAGVRRLFVYPLGFVADNSETVYEIGMLYKELALQNGIKEFVRLEALNEQAEFVATLAEVVLEEVKTKDKRKKTKDKRKKKKEK